MKFKKILIGIDDSLHAENAVQHGFELAKLLNAEVALAHVIEPIVLPDNEIGMTYPLEMIDAQNEASQQVIDRAIAKYAGDQQVTRFLEIGRPADMMIDFAEQFQADLIVLGTHSRTGLDRFLMGSVAEHVMRHSTVPVMVIPLKAVKS
ncbi:MAG: universal stress protein [Sphingobacteriaceae bacterium]